MQDPNDQRDRFHLIMATFSEGETAPTDRGQMIMVVFRKMMDGKHTLTRVVGIGSS